MTHVGDKGRWYNDAMRNQHQHNTTLFNGNNPTDTVRITDTINVFGGTQYGGMSTGGAILGSLVNAGLFGVAAYATARSEQGMASQEISSARQEASNTNYQAVMTGAELALSNYNSAVNEYKDEKDKLAALEQRLSLVENQSEADDLMSKKDALDDIGTKNSEQIKHYNDAKSDVTTLTNLKNTLTAKDTQINAEKNNLQTLEGQKPSTGLQCKITCNIPSTESLTDPSKLSFANELETQVANYYNNPTSAGNGIRQIKGEDGKLTYQAIESSKTADMETVAQIKSWANKVVTSNTTIKNLETQKKNIQDNAKNQLKCDEFKNTTITGENIDSLISQAEGLVTQNDVAFNENTFKNQTVYSGFTVSQFQTEKTKVKSQVDQYNTDKTDNGAALKKEIAAQKEIVKTKEAAYKSARTALQFQKTNLTSGLQKMSQVASAQTKLTNAENDLATDKNNGKHGGQRTKWQKFWGVNKGKTNRANIKQDKQNIKTARGVYQQLLANFESSAGFTFDNDKYNDLNNILADINTALGEQIN